MKRPHQLELDFGAKYLSLLEYDLLFARQTLAREQERVAELRQDVLYYRARLERLEMMQMQASLMPAGLYAAGGIVGGEANQQQTKPPIGATQMNKGPRPMFRDLKDKWNALSAEQQEKAQQAGWNADETEEKKQ